MTSTRKPKTVKDALTMENLRDNFLFCRNALHAWEERAASDLDKPEPGQWWQFFQCTRCDTQRIALIGREGDYIRSPQYKYPEGYQLDEKVTRSELRTQWAVVPLRISSSA